MDARAREIRAKAILGLPLTESGRAEFLLFIGNIDEVRYFLEREREQEQEKEQEQ